MLIQNEIRAIHWFKEWIDICSVHEPPDLFSIGLLGINFMEIQFKTWTFSFKKKHFRMSSANGINFTQDSMQPTHTVTLHEQSPASQQFVQQHVQGKNKENSKVMYYWLFVRGIQQWPLDSPHKWPVMQTVYPQITGCLGGGSHQWLVDSPHKGPVMQTGYPCHVVGFDHGLPCRVKNMARGTQQTKTEAEGRGFCRNWGPRAMFFTRHGRPWSNPIIARSLIDFFFILFTETWILVL